MMQPRSDFADMPELDYEGWRDALRPKWGRYNPEAMDRRTFIGRARSRSLYGFAAIDLGCNAHRVERTQRDVRLDGVDHYFVLFQVAGGSTIIQNDRVVQLSVGDAALVDSARPGTHVSEERCGQWISLQLPRQSLASHLGFDAQGGVLGRGETAAGRMLFDLVRDADTGDGSTSSPADFHMQLAVYDLIGALFAPSDPVPGSLQADKLHPHLRRREGPLCRTGVRSLRGGGGNRDLATLPSEVLHGAEHDLHAFHQFRPAGPHRASSASPGDSEHRPADQRDRLQQRL